MTHIIPKDDEQALSLYLRKHCKRQDNPLKRGFDIVFSALVLIFGAPIYSIIAIIIKFTSKGPVLYPSKRIGICGKVIYCWKFRSMVQNADQKLAALLESDPKLKKEWNETFKLKSDPRITKIGAFLRKTSLDELPQFWNVLKGDLSTVGPRPLSATEVLIVIEKGHKKIFSVRPGLTGLWQTSGRNLIQYEKRILLEKEYVEKQSLLLDLKLILKTITMMIFPKGAY